MGLERQDSAPLLHREEGPSPPPGQAYPPNSHRHHMAWPPSQRLSTCMARRLASNSTSKGSCIRMVIFHKAVAVNVWRRQIDQVLDPLCHVCKQIEELVLHRFFACPATRHMSDFAQASLHTIAGESQGPHRRFRWELCIFEKWLPPLITPLWGGALDGMVVS